jgi:hypothetical protein
VKPFYFQGVEWQCHSLQEFVLVYIAQDCLLLIPNFSFLSTLIIYDAERPERVALLANYNS